DEPARAAAQRPDPGRRRRHQDRHLPRPHAGGLRRRGGRDALDRGDRARRADGPGAGLPRGRAVPRAAALHTHATASGRQLLRARGRLMRTLSARVGTLMGRIARDRPASFAVVLTVILIIANTAVQPAFAAWSQIAPTLGTLAPFAIAGMAS